MIEVPCQNDVMSYVISRKCNCRNWNYYRCLKMMK